MQEEKKKNEYRMIQTQNENERRERIEEVKRFAQEIEKVRRKYDLATVRVVAQFKKIVEALELKMQLCEMRAADMTRTGSDLNIQKKEPE